MHECPQCLQVCYCDMDDSNDCRDADGTCYHNCDPLDLDEPDYFEDDPDSADAPTPGGEHG